MCQGDSWEYQVQGGLLQLQAGYIEVGVHGESTWQNEASPERSTSTVRTLQRFEFDMFEVEDFNLGILQPVERKVPILMR